jgi:tetratricopeptide (TPR) repeat protein
MADGERRMLFDIRGRRKNVVKVVYAILAVMMGASLFLVVGPVNIGSLLSSTDEVDRSAEIFNEQIERTEQRLRKDPNNEDILISLTRARINAGRANSEIDPTTGEAAVTVKARTEYEKANDAWARYLKVAKGEPNASLASLVAGTAFLLAQNSKTYSEAIEYLGAAADAARFAAQARPSLGAWTTLAAYAFLSGDKATGAEAGHKAKALARTKAEKKSIDKQLAAFEKQSKEIQKSKKEAEKAEKGRGKEALENPLGGLGGGSSPIVTP